MDYISVKEAAKRWNISERRVRALCESGRIEGVTHIGEWVWGIPEHTQRPADGRTLRYMKNRSLRTGAQNYSGVDEIRRSAKNQSLTETQKAKIIRSALLYDSKDIPEKTITGVFSLRQGELELRKALEILNARAVLNTFPSDEFSEKSLLSINRQLSYCIDEKKGGKLKDDENLRKEFAALFTQYSSSWQILHPIARASFVFTELLRLQPFERDNTMTAFMVLANEMMKAKLPPVFFDEDQTDQLKAALASAKLRGNTKQLVEMIIQAVTG